MLISLFLLAAMAVNAQPVGDGVRLLERVSEAAPSAKGWRAEGTLEFDVLRAAPVGGIAHIRDPITISTRGPLELRHIHGKLPGVLDQTVCDGLTAWHKNVLLGISSSIEETLSLAIAKECSPPVAIDWQNLLTSLRSAHLYGSDGKTGCTLVRAEYSPPTGLEAYVPNDHLGPVISEMCVDEATSAVLWERFEVTQGYSMHYVVEFTRIDRDPGFSPEEFKIPPDARDDTGLPVTLELLNSLPVYSAPALPLALPTIQTTPHPD